jgi:hypothetical protein
MCSFLRGDHEAVVTVIPVKRDGKDDVVLHDWADIKLGIQLLEKGGKAVTHPA